MLLFRDRLRLRVRVIGRETHIPSEVRAASIKHCVFSRVTSIKSIGSDLRDARLFGAVIQILFNAILEARLADVIFLHI